MRRPNGKLTCLAIAIALGWTAEAYAGDGVIEINEAAAMAGGVVPGDAPGFPVTITTGTLGGGPISFRLTGTLSFSGNIVAIEIPAGNDNVTIDLNGFGIVCSLPGPSGQCGTGISSVANNTTVMNGTISLMQDGVSLTGKGARVERVRAFKNHRYGISAADDCTVIDNLANDNGDNGILVGNGCLVSGNTANNNGQTTGAVTGDGICTGQGCNVTGNTVRNNKGKGLFLNTASGYSNNVISGNFTATVVNGTPTGQNLCNGSTTCP